MLGGPPRAHAVSLPTSEIITRAAAAKAFFRDMLIPVSSGDDLGLAAFKGNLEAEFLAATYLRSSISHDLSSAQAPPN